MNSLAYILAPLVLVLPALSGNLSERTAAQSTNGWPEHGPALGLSASVPNAPGLLDEARNPPDAHQVRIERRVVIRISPANRQASEELFANLPRRPLQTRFEEVPHGDCVAVQAISGVQATPDNRLLFFMQDRRIITASLERACTARAFYSGFYVESNADGQLCISRDRLQSRAGASCQINELHRLVAVRD